MSVIQPRAENGKTPMIIMVQKHDLIDLINRELKRTSREPIPNNADVTIRIPSGGDYSGMDLGIDTINIRYQR